MIFKSIIKRNNKVHYAEGKLCYVINDNSLSLSDDYIDKLFNRNCITYWLTKKIDAIIRFKKYRLDFSINSKKPFHNRSQSEAL